MAQLTNREQEHLDWLIDTLSAIRAGADGGVFASEFEQTWTSREGYSIDCRVRLFLPRGWRTPVTRQAVTGRHC